MIERLTSDSRRAGPGAAFFAWPGEAADGRRYIGDAVARGVSAVLWEKEDFSWDATWKIPNLGTRDLKNRAGFLAHEFYGKPSEALWVCGVTGTNGKTTCSQWIAAALSQRGEKTAVVGTLGAGFASRLSPIANTTPDALELHQLLKEFRGQGATAAAMEISSHGLDQGRVNGIAFDCALFTNLTHDHLDYHGTMEAYGEAKAKLFEMSETAVLNLDDPFGRELAKRSKVKAIGFSLLKSGKDVLFSSGNEIEFNGKKARLSISAPGRYNLSNALGVLGCLISRGVSVEEGAQLLSRLPPVPGRMQTVGDRPLVVIDYAHTPDALEKVLAALRPVAQARGGKLAVVFGAGGNRDATKRPEMGAVASRLADRVFLTSDNPRSEDPAKIIAAIREGTKGEVATDPDRAKAIRAAIAAAQPEDVILLAGKGHETTQEIGGRKLAFSDATVAAAALKAER